MLIPFFPILSSAPSVCWGLGFRLSGARLLSLLDLSLKLSFVPSVMILTEMVSFQSGDPSSPVPWWVSVLKFEKVGGVLRFLDLSLLLGLPWEVLWPRVFLFTRPFSG